MKNPEALYTLQARSQQIDHALDAIEAVIEDLPASISSDVQEIIDLFSSRLWDLTNLISIAEEEAEAEAEAEDAAEKAERAAPAPAVIEDDEDDDDDDDEDDDELSGRDLDEAVNELEEVRGEFLELIARLREVNRALRSDMLGREIIPGIERFVTEDHPWLGRCSNLDQLIEMIHD